MSRSRRIAGDAIASLGLGSSRTLLMMTGVAVGVAVLSGVIIVGQGTRAEIMEQVERHGLDMLMVRAGGDVQVFAPQADRGLASLLEADARAIEAEVPGVTMASGVQNQRGINVVSGERAVVTRAFGVEQTWMDIRRRGVAEGELFSDADVASMARVVILGHKVAEGLFPEGGAVGQTIRVNNEPYVVKGVAEEAGVSAGGEQDDWDDRIIVPMSTSARRLFNRPYLEQIVIRVADVSQVPQVAERVRELLRVRHGIGPGQHDDFFVREAEDIEGAALETSTTLLALLVVTSLIALFAGGLVIMNLMLMSVSQRSPEIGLRRAIGARASDITRQFLVEALLVSLLGGAVGLAAGLAAAAGLSAVGLVASRVTWLPFALALAACVLVGVAFGVHPARKAAAVNPVATLRGRSA